MSRETTQKIILTEDIRKDVLRFARAGIENIKIAYLMGWCEDAYYNVMKRNPEFKREVAAVKALSNARVEESLYNMAIGFKKTEEKVVTLAGGLHNQSTHEVVEYEKYHPPQVAAAKHYLSNRNPDRWKEKSELVVKPEDIPDSELERRVREILNGKEKKGEGAEND